MNNINCYSCNNCQDFDESGTTEYYCTKLEQIVEPTEPACFKENQILKQHYNLGIIPYEDKNIPMLEPETVRLCVLDSASKNLYIEDICEDELRKYQSINSYVETNYMVSEGYTCSIINRTQYFKFGQKAPIEVNFEEL